MLRYCHAFSILTIVPATFVLFVRSFLPFWHKKILPKSISLCKTMAITAHMSLVFVLALNTRQTRCSGLKIQAFKNCTKKHVPLHKDCFTLNNVFLCRKKHNTVNTMGALFPKHSGYRENYIIRDWNWMEILI